MQLLISAEDNLDDVLVQVGHLFGQELQVVGRRELSAVAASRSRTGGASSTRAASKSSTRAASKRASAATGGPGISRGESAAKRTGAARNKKRAAPGPRSRPSTSMDATPVRAWARANGHPVNARGRLPAAVLEAYAAAHN